VQTWAIGLAIAVAAGIVLGVLIGIDPVLGAATARPSSSSGRSRRSR
jgi:ABC-type nitrate/sulfonate/bicarbonate transport system permease component